MSWRTILLAAACLSASSPPGWCRGAGWLALVGLGALYALADGSRRPLRAAWVVGLVHVLAFSWSLRHFLWVGYVAIGVVGAFYYSLAIAWTKALAPRIGGPLAFGCAVAASCWLRANMPEIPYPHAQPVHGLARDWFWIGVVGVGGEPLGNLLLGACAAACVDLWRAWRVGVPSFARARGVLLALAVVTLAARGLEVVNTIARTPQAAFEVRVAAVQPNLRVRLQLELGVQGARECMRRLVSETERVAGPSVGEPPDLVLWPESMFRGGIIEGAGGSTELVHDLAGMRLHPHTMLLAGGWLRDAQRRERSAALLVDSGLRLRGWQEKLAIVPAGETIPFAGWLPAGMREALLDAIRESMGQAPDLQPGRPRAPLAVGPARIAVLTCFDNAFPSLARAQVAAGANLIVVLSNESWYEGGAELDQLVASSAVVARVTRTPVVRCTLDGDTLAMDGNGRLRQRLPRVGGDPFAPPETLTLSLPLGSGRLPPLAWLHEVVLALVLASGAALAWHVVKSWARLLALRVRPRQPSGRDTIRED